MQLRTPERYGSLSRCSPAARRLISPIRQAVFLAAIALATSGCSTVARQIIQGTDHGSANANVPESPHYRLLQLTTRDGTHIAAQFGRAADAAGNPLTDGTRRPTVIYCYAGGHTLRRSADTFERFRRLGVNIIIPEYPGFGLSDGRASEAGCYAAADAAYDYLLTQPDIDPSQLIAAGWSVGGGVAIDLASRRPVSGVIVVATATRMSDVVERMADGRAPWSWLPHWVFEALVRRSKFDSLAKLPAVKAPVFFVEGSKDELVPHAMTDRLAAAAPTPVTRHTVSDATHATVVPQGGDALWQALDLWIHQLPASPPTSTL